jgi:hypothetical protein
LYVHPTLVVTPQGLALGVVDAWMWARKPKGEAAVKERVRWVEGTRLPTSFYILQSIGYDDLI